VSGYALAAVANWRDGVILSCWFGKAQVRPARINLVRVAGIWHPALTRAIGKSKAMDMNLTGA